MTDSAGPMRPDGPAAILRARIAAREATVAVIGLGYVGLPLTIVFADAGFHVLGFDIDPARAAAVDRGESHVTDVADADLARHVASGRLRATADGARLAVADVLSICVPTPLSKTRDPDISHVRAAARQVASTLRRGQLVILESTTYPGTTRDEILPILEQSGLRVGEEIFLAFSPERVDPGNTRWNIRTTPKVVGGIDPVSTELAVLLFAQAIDTVVPVSTPEVAELVKLHENTFRAVNIALANELALMCDRLGIDVWEVIGAASTKPFGFMPFYPGPGIGGHCIPLDPLYLSWKMRTLDDHARLIAMASEINGEMPHHVLTKIATALDARGRGFAGARVLVLGVAYKADIADPRESPALDIMHLLAEQGAGVSYCDPHVPEVRVGIRDYEAVPYEAATIADADCIVIVTPHHLFDLTLLEGSETPVIDTRNALRRSAS